MSAADDFKQLFTHDIFQALLDAELSEDQAAELSLSIYRRIQKNWGGCDVYIPSGSLAEKQNRNRQIRAAFNGKNHDELAALFGMHPRSIERIVAG